MIMPLQRICKTHLAKYPSTFSVCFWVQFNVVMQLNSLSLNSHQDKIQTKITQFHIDKGLKSNVQLKLN